MKALIFGSGAREHALAWRLAREGWEVCVAPGNAGIARRFRCIPGELDRPSCLQVARAEAADLAVVGPEGPLALGLADWLRAIGQATVGPSKAAARIEGSKVFAKWMMQEAGVPTARHVVARRLEEALPLVQELGGRVAVKADGLAAGKGVVVAGSVEEAERALHDYLVQGTLGEAARRVVVEERLEGPEVSLMALCHGRDATPLPLSHDYKRLRDGDAGPNTGGMGAVAPTPRLGPERAEALCRELILPVLDAMERHGAPFSGVLYAGLMLTAEGPRVLEYNCRFGDPETQALVLATKGPFGEALAALARGSVPHGVLATGTEVAVGTVVAAPGYPEAPRLGSSIEGLEKAEAACEAVFLAGVAAGAGVKLVTAGGRVATCMGVGADLASARARAAAGVAALSFEGKHARSDVGT